MTDNRTMTVSDEMIEAALNQKLGGEWVQSHMEAAQVGVALAMRALDPQAASLEAALERAKAVARERLKVINTVKDENEQLRAALQKDA